MKYYIQSPQFKNYLAAIAANYVAKPNVSILFTLS